MYNTVTASAKRLTGLMSGIDTDSAVKTMLSGVQTKIDKQQQQKTLLSWKKEAYQDVISKINAFSDKFTGNASLSRLTRVSTFRSFTTTLSDGADKYVKISAGADGQAGSLTINSISQLATATKVSSGSAVSQPLKMKVDEETSLDSIAGKSFDIVLDGQRKTIKIDDADTLRTLMGDASADTIDATTLHSYLQDKVQDAFGSTSRISLNLTAPSDPTAANAKYEMEFVVQTGSHLTLQAQQTDNSVEDAAFRSALGISVTATNRLSTSSMLGSVKFANGDGYDIFQSVMKPDDAGSDWVTPSPQARFEINGVEFLVGSNTTIASLISQVNASDAGVTMSYSSVTDQFTLVSNMTGLAGDVEFKDLSLLDADGNAYGEQTKMMQTLFGASNSNDLGVSQVTKGQNALVEIDGQLIERGTNTFNVDGYSVTLLAEMEATEPDIKVTVTQDTEPAMTVIKEFVEEYNKLIEELNALINEKPDKDYSPLTDAQREALSDSEIEKWESAAKTGLLYNDSEIRDLLTKMRSAFISPIEDESGKTLTFASIGITSSSVSTDWGKLNLDEDKLVSALTNNLDTVIKMFTNESSISTNSIRDMTDTGAKAAANKTRQLENGLGNRLADIFSSKTSTSYTYEGTLVKLTGIGMIVTADSTYAKNLKSIESTLQRLYSQYEKQEERQYARFTALETALARMESQSSYLFSSTSN